MSKTWHRVLIVLVVLTFTFSCTSTAFATADDPINAINNLTDFMFGLIRAIGIILLAFGIVQIGLSLKSHDPSQRANVRPDRVLF